MISGAVHRVRHTFRRLQRAIWLRNELVSEIERLAPWYQPINFGYGIRTRPVDKGGNSIGLRTHDRGTSKWRDFILPNLPFSLRGKRVLEVGCNAALNLVECVRLGASETVGVEKADHYFQQARFVTRAFTQLEQHYIPLRIYQGSMEHFDYEALGRFDLAMLLNVIYHIGKSADYAHLDKMEIASLQVQTLRKLARVARYMLFSGNPLEDGGRGKGRESLLKLIRQADLSVEKVQTYNHSRGLIVLTKSKIYEEKATFSIKCMINKYFLPIGRGAEREFLDLYLRFGRDGFDVSQTRYYRLRTAQTDWRESGMAHLPDALDCHPVYWVVPWSYKDRWDSFNKESSRFKTEAFPMLYDSFVELFNSVMRDGFDHVKGEIPGYLLSHPEFGEVFLGTDGNHRMAVLSYLADQSQDRDLKVSVKVKQVVRRDALLHYPLAQQLIAEGYFTEADVLRWFDNAFWFLEKDASAR